MHKKSVCNNNNNNVYYYFIMYGQFRITVVIKKMMGFRDVTAVLYKTVWFKTIKML